MQLQYLCMIKLDEDIRERLGHLPPKLENLYSEIYDRLWTQPGEAQRHITKNVLSWLLCAQETLKLEEFLAAVSVTSKKCFKLVSKDKILDMCCNLVVFDTSLDTFRFAHLSVREFLEKQPDYVSSAVNALAAETCLLGLINAAQIPTTRSYLDQKNYSRIEISLLQNGLGRYIEIYWAAHCQLADDRRAGCVLKDLLSFFLGESDPGLALTNWIDQIRRRLRQYDVPWGMEVKLSRAIKLPNRRLSIACAFDLSEVVENFTAEQIADANLQADENCTAVYIALECGNLEVVKVLVTKKAAKFTKAVLKAAARNEEIGKEIMTLLLRECGQEIKVTEAVLKAAARNEENGKEIMTLLLQQRSKEIRVTEAAVKAAARNGRSGKEIMKLLLQQRGQEISITEAVFRQSVGIMSSID